jgi:hypothetical protein
MRRLPDRASPHERNDNCGILDLKKLIEAAEKNGLMPVETIEMPANKRHSTQNVMCMVMIECDSRLLTWYVR